GDDLRSRPGGSRRAQVRRAALYGRSAGSGSADSNERRNARQQFSALADRVRRNLGHRHALARFPLPASARGDPRVSEARSPVRRHQVRAGRRQRQVTRVLSGAALVLLAIAVVWFAPPIVFFVVGETLLVLAFIEYRRLADAVGLHVPAVAGAAATVLT